MAHRQEQRGSAREGAASCQRWDAMRWRRVSLVVIAAVLIIPRPALAHTVGGESGVRFEIELMLLGGVLVAGGIAYRVRDSAKSIVSGVLLGLGGALVAASFIVPGSGDGNAPAPATNAIVNVVRPDPAATVAARAPVIVEAEVTGGEVASDPSATNAGHLHVFVDGVLQEMLYSASTEVKLSRGKHTITVEYTDSQHRSFNPPIADSIEVTAK
jgi:hypothetical protein